MRRRNHGCFFYFFIIGLVIGASELLIEYWYISLSIIVLLCSFIIFKKTRINQFRKTQYGTIDIDAFNGREFELFCAQLLRDCGYTTNVTKASGDHGVDVIAKNRFRTYAIQCKHYSNNVGNKAIQEAYAGKDIYKCDVAVVMTNSYFTKQAQNEAQILGVSLWDRDKLLSFMMEASEKEQRLKKKQINKDINVTNNNKEFDIESIETDKIEINDGYPKTYDRLRGIYLEGLYIVGKDIPQGRYYANIIDENIPGEICIFNNEEDYDNNCCNVIKVTNINKYPLQLEDESYITLDNVEMSLHRKL